jgi:hypothetical protein
MSDYETLFPGRFLKAADFDGRDVTYTIRTVRAEAIEDKDKAILTFSEVKKSMVMNRTNAEAIKLMFGRETNDWVGRRVTFFPAGMADPFTGERIIAIRVRGSPDIKAPASAIVKRGRKDIKVSVVPTGANSAVNASDAEPITPAMAKSEAWRAFIGAHPAAPKTEAAAHREAEWKRALADMFPGKRAEDYTVDDGERVRVEAPGRYVGI